MIHLCSLLVIPVFLSKKTCLWYRQQSSRLAKELKAAFSFRGAEGEVFFKVYPPEVGVLFALGEVLDAFLHVVADGADGDLAVFVGSGFPIKGFHQSVGEEAV